MALPSPREPPVTMATCPDRDIDIALERMITPFVIKILLKQKIAAYFKDKASLNIENHKDNFNRFEDCKIL
jgi:hypothetical protein